MPDWFTRLYANFDRELHGNLGELGYHRTTDALDAKALLGRPLVPAEETIEATGRTIIAQHLV